MRIRKIMNTNNNKEVTDQYSLRGRVFQKIREDILAGNYAEKEELREAAISKEMGVSRTPVREALRQLELEGLVTIVPNKGAHVNGISAKDVRDIYTIRSYLEGLCARWACEHITEDQLEGLEEIVCISEFRISKGHREQMAEMDSRFHVLLYASCGSKILEHVLTDYHQYVERVRRNTLSSLERATEAVQEHKSILNALRNKDADTAEKLANEHIYKSMKNIQNHGLENLMKKKDE